MPAGHEWDPLLAVLDGDPVAPDADDATREAHEAAEADVLLLRGALRDIGDALAAAPVTPAAAAPGPAPADVLAARRRARRRSAVTWGAGLAAAAAFTGVMYLGATGAVRGDAGYSASDAKAKPDAGNNEKAADPGASGYRPDVACASLAVEGTVVALRPLTDGHVEVTLEAERYWVPEQEASDAPVAVTVLPEDARADLPVGTRALVVEDPSGSRWATGDRLTAERAALDAAGPEPGSGSCPPG
ncbi:hypothetical protein [Streptomyces fragilis]|uniref:DUF5666 domain-containing protein n=1 Tax=Streptomyces fragilis TaxID=67301 RepID=A0ABV2YGZ9_9ACTN|nr:hypothetical protein [Streptomyces fragilis]